MSLALQRAAPVAAALAPLSDCSQGLWPACLVPTLADGCVDLPKLLGHVNHLLRAGCDGVTLFGTCGEGASFSVAERKQVLEYVVKAGVSPRKLLVATYACALPDAVELTRHATAFGVYGVMFIPPFYFSNPTDDGVVCPLSVFCSTFSVH